MQRYPSQQRITNTSDKPLFFKLYLTKIKGYANDFVLKRSFMKFMEGRGIEGKTKTTITCFQFQ